VGAPFIESTQDNLKLTAPLTAITAAVVGVIASLAIFFATHIFWPNGLNANLDWIALLATLVAGFILFKFKLNIIKLIGIFALFGLVHQWLI
jgi:chromate transporter